VKPIIIGFSEEPPTLELSLSAGGRSREYAALFSGFLAALSPEQQPVPYLAEELPSLEKATWTVLPDGRAETTYRPNRRATWHDGKPVTAHDFVFAHQAHLDPAVPGTRIEVDRRIAAVRALDDQTLFRSDALYSVEGLLSLGGIVLQLVLPGAPAPSAGGAIPDGHRGLCERPALEPRICREGDLTSWTAGSRASRWCSAPMMGSSWVSRGWM